MTVISSQPDVTPSVVRQVTGVSKIRRIKLVVSLTKIRGESHKTLLLAWRFLCDGHGETVSSCNLIHFFNSFCT